MNYILIISLVITLVCIAIVRIIVAYYTVKKKALSIVMDRVIIFTLFVAAMSLGAFITEFLFGK